MGIHFQVSGIKALAVGDSSGMLFIWSEVIERNRTRAMFLNLTFLTYFVRLLLEQIEFELKHHI